MAPDSFENAANIGGDGKRIVLAHINLRHAGCLPAALNDGHDHFPALIAEGGLGAEKIRPADVAATKVGAMAGSATNAIDSFSARDLNRVSRWPFLARHEAALRKCGQG